MPATNQGWPDAFGFRISGCGPCYILAVDEGSSAHAAGLQPGDQILEIEGHNVSSLTSEALVNLAQECADVPPSIGVVSRIQQVEILPDASGRFGFSLTGDSPLQVETVTPESPASDTGIRPDDYVMEVNGVPVRHLEAAVEMMTSLHSGTLRLGLLCLSRKHKRSSNSSVREYVQSTEAVHQERRSKAQEFNKKVDEILGDQPEVKEKVFTVLKQYAAERKVEYLAYALPMILSQESQQSLIDNIRYVPHSEAIMRAWESNLQFH